VGHGVEGAARASLEGGARAMAAPDGHDGPLARITRRGGFRRRCRTERRQRLSGKATRQEAPGGLAEAAASRVGQWQRALGLGSGRARATD